MPELLTTKGVRILLGGVSYATLDKFRRYLDCPLPHGRAGRAWFYQRDKVLQWVEDNALLDPNRPVRDKLEHERRGSAVVAGTSMGEKAI